jgi:hypothetical protein
MPSVNVTAAFAKAWPSKVKVSWCLRGAVLGSGVLVRMLEDWCPPFPDFFLCYPGGGGSQPPSRLSSTRFVC